MNLKQSIQQKVGDKKYPKLLRVKLGKALMTIAALPLGTSILFPVATAMMIPIKPSLWAKDKIRYFREWRSLR